jgi:hypothetical protein
MMANVVVVVNTSMSAAAGTPVYFAMMVGFDSGPGVLPVPGAQLARVIGDQDEGTAGRRELGPHIFGHGLGVELGRCGRGIRRRRSRPGPRPAARARTAARRAGPGRTDMRVIRVVLAGPAHACSSGAFPLPAGAEMIVTASRPRDPAWRPGRYGRSALARPLLPGTNQWPTCRSSRHLLRASGRGNPP